MGAEQANTGYNWGNVITLYRNEELLKVLLHELVHFLKLEKGINNDLHIQHFIKHGLDVESESFHPLETFTDTGICDPFVECLPPTDVIDRSGASRSQGSLPSIQMNPGRPCHPHH